MATKAPSPSDLCRMTEEEARLYLEKIRWPDGAFCPHCGGVRAMELKGKSCRPGLRKCGDCRKQFTVTVGTIFERSHIALRHWVYAFARMCASKKGISAHQLHRELGITYKSAWFMCHRIRHAFADDGTTPNLMGTVEVDELYVGPRKPRYKQGQVYRARGTRKQPVVALVERGGRSRMRVAPDVSGKTLKGMIKAHVHPSATLMTDEWKGYIGAGKGFAGHKTIKHKDQEYAKPDGTSTNTVESYFALFRRGLIGTFHHVSVQHLQRYCDEFSFRWDHRGIPDLARTRAAIAKTGGKRLYYRDTAA